MWCYVRIIIIIIIIIIITFKAIYGLAPKYICDLVAIRKQCKYSLRSYSGLLLQPTTLKTKKTLGDRSFSVAATKLCCGNKVSVAATKLCQLIFAKRTILLYLKC